MKHNEYYLSEELLRPKEYLNPFYHMSPFDNTSLEEHYKILQKPSKPLVHLAEYFGQKEDHYLLTVNAREAIYFSLKELNLKTEDEVWIVTTSGGKYVSGCVTKEIEKFCKWSMSYTSAAKAIFVIHEFGFPYENLQDLKKYNLPIIEDAAYAYGSVDQSGHVVGSTGDYSVFSFSKSCPMPYGGLLKTKKKISAVSSMSEKGHQQLAQLLNFYLPNIKESFNIRKDIHKSFSQRLSQIGLEPRFSMSPGAVPTAFVFKLQDENVGQKLKMHLNGVGIESSVFYGSGGYFLPCHQRMGMAAVEYICLSLSEFMKTINKLNK